MDRRNIHKYQSLDFVKYPASKSPDKNGFSLLSANNNSKIFDLQITQRAFMHRYLDRKSRNNIELPRIINNSKQRKQTEFNTYEGSAIPMKGTTSWKANDSNIQRRKKMVNYDCKQLLLLDIMANGASSNKLYLTNVKDSDNIQGISIKDKEHWQKRKQYYQISRSDIFTKIILFNHGIKELIGIQFGPSASPHHQRKNSSKGINFGNNRNKIFIQENACIVPQKKIKMKAYVQEGNNSRMVKQIIRKRNWIKIITEKQKKHQANILWTSFIDPNYYKTSQCVSKFKQNYYENRKSEQQEQEFNKSNENQSETDMQYLQHSAQSQLLKPIISIQSLQSLQTIKSSIIQSSSRDIHEKEVVYIDNKRFKMKRQHFHTRMSESNKQKLIKIQLIDFRLHNHFRQHFELSDKKHLFQNIKLYCQKNKIDEKVMIPVTYHIKSYQRKKQIKLIKTTSVEGLTNVQDGSTTTDSLKTISTNKQTQYNELPVQVGQSDKLWLIKPGQDSNRGNNITIANTRAKIENAIQQLSKIGKSAMVQQYIEPLLYKNRKFDIRCYVLLVSVRGVLRGYWYKQGYLRTCCKQFTLDPQNQYGHLTNDAVQKNHKDYGKYQQANKLSFSDLANFLKTKDKFPTFSNIIDSMKILAQHSIKSVQNKLKLEQKIFCFEIFGYDFLIDKDGKTWLIEVNTNPCLQFSGSLVSRIVSHMVENTFKIVLDTISGNTIQGGSDDNKYQCIF